MLNEITKVEENIRNYEMQLALKETEINNMSLKADISGYVISSCVSYEGQVINGLQEVFTIMPVESQYVFKGYIADKDISDVTKGDKAQIKLQAYSFYDYGMITGKIIHINPVAANKDGKGNMYEVIVQIDKNKLHKDINLKSGLSGSIEVNIGKRTVMDYFLDPIIGGLSNSLKEK